MFFFCSAIFSQPSGEEAFPPLAIASSAWSQHRFRFGVAFFLRDLHSRFPPFPDSQRDVDALCPSSFSCHLSHSPTVFEALLRDFRNSLPPLFKAPPVDLPVHGSPSHAETFLEVCRRVPSVCCSFSLCLEIPLFQALNTATSRCGLAD